MKNKTLTYLALSLLCCICACTSVDLCPEAEHPHITDMQFGFLGIGSTFATFGRILCFGFLLQLVFTYFQCLAYGLFLFGSECIAKLYAKKAKLHTKEKKEKKDKDSGKNRKKDGKPEAEATNKEKGDASGEEEDEKEDKG